MLSKRKVGIRDMVDTHTINHTKGQECEDPRIKFITEQLKDPKNRTHKTMLQQCKMFDTWLTELEQL